MGVLDKIQERLGLSPDEMNELKRELSSGGVYSDTEILAALHDGHIVIEPLDPDNVRSTSVDVTLGEHFYLVDSLRNQSYYNPYDQADIDRYFTLKRAITHLEWSMAHKGTRFEGIDERELIIVLAPGERILAHTQEFIGILRTGTWQLLAKSTTGRNGLVVCKDAGLGDTDFLDRITMEIQNDNQESMPLVVGRPIAQVVFFRSGPVQRSYASIGRYQRGTDIGTVMTSWRPDGMLPKPKLRTDTREHA